MAEAKVMADVVVDNYLNNVLIGLIVSLLVQDTSQLLLYKSPVIYYLAIRDVSP